MGEIINLSLLDHWKGEWLTFLEKRNSLSDDSRGTSMQSIVNHMEREEEISIIGGNKRNSVDSDWSDLISIDEEAEYRKKL